MFLGICASMPYRLSINHRWDSTTCAVLALCLLVAGRPFVAGFVGMLAACFTPSLLPFAAALLVGIEDRKFKGLFSLGAASLVVPVLAYLSYQGALRPMIDQVYHIAPFYVAANKLGPDLVPATKGVLAFTSNLVLLMPLAGLSFGFWRLGQKKWLLLPATTLLLAVFPRFGIDQLIFAAPLFIVIVVVVVAESIREGLALATLICVPLMALAVSVKTSLSSHLTWVTTDVGPIRASASDSAAIKRLVAMRLQGTSIFVFPYSPIVYFLTRSIPASYYSFLQPGMMRKEDEVRAFTELLTVRPKTVITVRYPDEVYKAIWPGVEYRPLSLLEGYLAREYAIREVARAGPLTLTRLTPLPRSGDDLCIFKASRNTNPSVGRLDAPVTIRMFSDFQCPDSRASWGVVKRWLVGKEGLVRLEFRQLPLDVHSWARSAAEDTACVGMQRSDSFWRIHDAVFEIQDTITDRNVHEKIRELVETDGAIDQPGYAKCVEQSLSVGLVRDDTDEAAKLGVYSTPAFLVNGRRVTGVTGTLSRKDLNEIIRQALDGESH